MRECLSTCVALPEACPGCHERVAVTLQEDLLTWSCDCRLANRTGDWVRLICVVLAAEPVKVVVAGETTELGEAWLQ